MLKLQSFNMEIKVSVIIPTYKRSIDIARAVDSVLNQTIDSFEVIVVDDNGIESSEGVKTSNVMKQYSDDNRVKYIQHKHNKNGSAARNTGIREARGKYISFLDDDDAYLPTRLEEMYNKMESLDNTWGACYTGYVKNLANGTHQYSNERTEGDLFKQALMRSLYIGTGSNLFFRHCVVDEIGLFDEQFTRNQDLEYLVRVLKKYKMAYVDNVLMLAFYDVRTVSFTYNQSLERESMFRNRFSKYLSELSQKEQREVLIMYELDWIRTCLSYKKIFQVFKTIIRSRIPLKIYYRYIKYAIDRKKNNTCYGFIVSLN